MKLSIVTTLYNTAAYIVDFHKRVSVAAQKIVEDDYEIVFVNDGSPDNSLHLAIDLFEADSHVVIVDLSRNFGHHKAMMTGLSYARGELVFLIDSDLEEKPEWIGVFYELMISDNCDVVYGKQNQRKGGFIERVTGQYFWKLFNLLAGLDLPNNIVTARLMTRRYVNALLKHEEREVFIAGLWHITGFIQKPQFIDKTSNGHTTYTFKKKISLFVNSITSFSNTPLVSIFYIGIFISSFSSVYFIYIIFHWLFMKGTLNGWTSVIASIWLLGGMIISFIGIIGIYLSKIFSETKKRPYTIIRQVLKKY